ncbi:MAG TPA: nucleotide exchange factor GrpE [Planctomycetota bacterium]|nr:nucleotide exchange factor GrpE [Planctomycetota bacterium]
MSEEKAANPGSEAEKPADNGTVPATEPPVAEAARWKAKADEYLELARRAKADFINYQDRVRRDKADWNRQSLEGFVRELLPALDGFALAKFEDPKLTEAVKLLEKEFLRVLAKTGVTPIETAGRDFDPAYHDAVAMDPGGTQLEEVRRGWLFDGKVLRPASVRLVKPKA